MVVALLLLSFGTLRGMRCCASSGLLLVEVRSGFRFRTDL